MKHTERKTITLSKLLVNDLDNIALDHGISSFSEMVKIALNEYVNIYNGRKHANILSVNLVEAMESVVEKTNLNVKLIIEMLKDELKISDEKYTKLLLKSRGVMKEVNYE